MHAPPFSNFAEGPPSHELLPRCSAATEPEHKFCQHCGHGLEQPSATVSDASPMSGPNLSTVRFQASDLPTARGLRRNYQLDELFAGRSELVIGRAPECDIRLAHPTVSRLHARLVRTPQGLELRDLGSVNGVQVNGRLIQEAALVRENERVGIGPFLFTLSGGMVHVLDNSRSLRLEARNLEKVVVVKRGVMRKLLDDVNLVVEPGEFISLLGPSGSGKSTLMDCLNGRRPATSGKVLANGEDFYRHYDNFRQSLGYVPQRDIVHTQLTVERALYYTARLRLPTDTGPRELNTRIEEVLALMELVPHRNTLIDQLSGGQIKRVSLGAELLASPALLYIDEATSGLDAGTEARMMHLFRDLANEGKSVVCITHNVDNVDLCNLILILMRGKLVYYGPPQEARTYFGVSRISEVYDQLAKRDPEKWEREFAVSSLFVEFVEKRLAAVSGEAALAAPAPALLPNDNLTKLGLAGLGATVGAGRLPSESQALSPAAALQAKEKQRRRRTSPVHQFLVLTLRYAELVWRDQRSFRLLLFQAPLVALFILLGFLGRPYQARLTVPRPLTADEKQTLQDLQTALTIVPDQDKVSPQQLKMMQMWNLPPQKDDDPPLSVAQFVKGLQKFRDQKMLDMILKTEGPAVPDRDVTDPRYTFVLLFLLAITILWFGCNNAAKEIVKEEAIYGRERAVNLALGSYLASKFVVLSIITAFQVLQLMVCVYGVMELAHYGLGLDRPRPFVEVGGQAQGYLLDYGLQYGVLVLLGMTGVALGLFLSTCVSTPDRANALLPYVLIPQIILGGGIMAVEMQPLKSIAMMVSPVYWAYSVIRSGASTLPSYFPGANGALEVDQIWLPCLALVVQLVVLLLATAWFLRQKDVRRA